jgi:hypothetical protein
MEVTITVKVGIAPGGAMQDVGLVNDRSVRKALELAGLVADGYQIRVSGADATLDTTLSDGQTVLLLRKIKGNAPDYSDDVDGDDDTYGDDDLDDDAGDEENDDFIRVRIGKLPGVITEITLNGDRSVRCAIDTAGLGDISGLEIRSGGRVVGLDHILSNNDSVHLVRKIKGN